MSVSNDGSNQSQSSRSPRGFSSTSQRERTQAEECARFRRECETDVEHISGLDWCDDVDYHDYVPKRTIYATQPQCFALETLINSWDSQLGLMKGDLPAPQWPHDPYNRQPMTIDNIRNYSRRYEETQTNRRLPEKLGLFVADLDVNADKWQTLIDSNSNLTNSLRDFYIEKGIYEPIGEGRLEDMSDDDILRENPMYHFIALLDFFLENYDVMWKDYISPEEFIRLKPQITSFIHTLNENNRRFTSALGSIREQLHEIDNNFDENNPTNRIEERET